MFTTGEKTSEHLQLVKSLENVTTGEKVSKRLQLMKRLQNVYNW